MFIDKPKGLAFLFFFVLGFAVYSNTFEASFHYDDAHVIADLTSREVFGRFMAGGPRVVAHLTFLLNYRLHGADVFGYHVFNTVVHAATACFVFIFLHLILSLSNSMDEASETLNPGRRKPPVLPPLSDPVFWPAFIGAVLVLVHPIATQAVTYISQRYTSLAGFFYMGSLSFFVGARIKFRQGCGFFSATHLVRYLCAVVMAILALSTKEMAITLPAALLLTEYFFIQSDFREAGKRVVYLLPLLSTSLVIPAWTIGGEKPLLARVAALQDYTWGAGIPRQDYLFTQLKVILGTYLRLLVWPTGQNIDHDYLVSKALLDLPAAGSLAALSLLLGVGVWLFNRARLVSFGIVWFLVTISPTSSIVPNSEFVAEHRAYIPLIGLAFSCAGLPAWQRRWKGYMCVLLPAVVIFSGLTYARNRVWRTDLTLWGDSVQKSPNKARPHNNLGNALANEGKLGEAIAHYAEAIRISPGHVDAHNNLGVALVKMGNFKGALFRFRHIIQLVPRHVSANVNIGICYMKMGALDKTISHLQTAVEIDPNHVEAHYNLGLAYAEKGDYKTAFKEMKFAKGLASHREWRKVARAIRGDRDSMPDLR